MKNSNLNKSVGAVVLAITLSTMGSGLSTAGIIGNGGFSNTTESRVTSGSFSGGLFTISYNISPGLTKALFRLGILG